MPDAIPDEALRHIARVLLLIADPPNERFKALPGDPEFFTWGGDAKWFDGGYWANFSGRREYYFADGVVAYVPNSCDSISVHIPTLGDFVLSRPGVRRFPPRPPTYRPSSP
jgi:hypothetical protein